MRTIKMMTLLVLCAMFFVQCKTQEGKVNFNKPDSVALSFMKELAALNFEEAKKLGTSGTKEILGFLEMAMGMAEEAEKEKMKKEAAEGVKSLKKADCKVNGDEAVCTLCCTPDGEPMVGEEINLKKEEGKWLVHMSKEDMQGGGEGAPVPEPSDD